jgi:hypothetical protein
MRQAPVKVLLGVSLPATLLSIKTLGNYPLPAGKPELGPNKVLGPKSHSFGVFL